MKIYTKRGDQGQTDLFGGARVSKAHPRVLAYGSIDAANSAIGFAAVLSSEIQTPLRQIMSDLLDIGSELASVPQRANQTCFLSGKRTEELEHLIDALEARLPALKNFVLPTGCELSARLHLARTAIRRAEQEVIFLHESGETVRSEIIVYLNRLSDLFFTWGRWANIQNNVEEVLWVKN